MPDTAQQAVPKGGQCNSCAVRDRFPGAVDASHNLASNRDRARDITRTVIDNVKIRKCDPGRIPPFGFDRLRIDSDGNPVEQIRYMANGSRQILDPKTLQVRIVVPAGDSYGKIKSHRVVLTPSCEDRVELAKRILRMGKSMGYTQVADQLNQESKAYEYLLSGVCVCGRCGALLHGHTIKNNRPKAGPVSYHKYTCRTTRKHGPKVRCAMRIVHAEFR